MTDGSTHDPDDMMHVDLELSDREIFCIGRIVALWGSLEHEIFTQTLAYFDAASVAPLPRQMNNLQPSHVLELWKTHVADKAEGRRKEVLQKQYEAICNLSKYRNAIVHGMWDWSKKEPEKIFVSRVRKDALEVIQFTAKDLAYFSSELGKIRFRISYPGGIEDLARAITDAGPYMSRQFVAIVTNSSLAEDWLSTPRLRAPESSTDQDQPLGTNSGTDRC